MFDVFENRLELSGTLTTVTALRISQGRSTEPIGSDLPVVKDSLGRPLIPGSSFKGALRSRLESFLRGIFGDDRKLVANPALESEWALTSDENKILKNMSLTELVRLCWAIKDQDFQSFDFEQLTRLIRLKTNVEAGRENPRPQDIEILSRLPEAEVLEDAKKEFSGLDDVFTQAILSKTDLISRLFGSPWLASKFQVRDLTVQPDLWFGQYQERDGVSIDRDTETASDGKLYDFQVVPAGTPFEFKAVVENAEDWELGLLMIGLYQFENEMIPLGGGRSRGLGVVKLNLDEMMWANPSNPQELIEYLRHLVEGRLQSYIKTPPQIEKLKRSWSMSLLNHLTQLSTGERIHA